MILVVRQWYSALSTRERRLTLLMLAIAGMLLAWLLVVLPLGRAYDSALERHLESVDRNGRVRALAEAPARPRAGSGSAGQDLGLAIAESASRAGLVLDSNTPTGDATTVAIPSASPVAVIQWLRGLELEGYRVAELRMVPAADNGVSVTARLDRPAR